MNLISVVLTCVVAAAAACAPAQLVAPESLEQGFVIVVEDTARLASPASPIFLASNHVGWNPADPAMRLEPRSDGLWQIVLPKPETPGSLQFKFTRGDWDRCEVAADLSDISNRTLPRIEAPADGQQPILQFVIERWSDERPEALARRAVDPYRDIDAQGDVRRLQVAGGAGPAAGMTRDLLVWLPPGYDDPHNADRRYPVLYLQDGQNIFEQLPGVPGEWRADETATMLIDRGDIRPLIIVGVPHAGAHRAMEYLPTPAYGFDAPAGDEYVSFLINEVMPRVERAFRVSTAREDTAIGGASLGAVISLYAYSRHPDRFGLLLLESISLLREPPDSPVFDMVEDFDRWPERIHIGMGGQEAGVGSEADELNETYLGAAHSLHHAFAGKVESRHAALVTEADALHDENAWADRFGRALVTLFRP